MEERLFGDWIVDAAWEHDFSHIVLALAHNSLLRFHIQNLQELLNDKFTFENSQREGSKTICVVTKPLDKREENIYYGDLSVLSSGHLSENRKNITYLNIPNDIQQQVINFQKENNPIVATAECTEKCVLFCGRVVMMSGSWESAVLLAGMVSNQLIIWGPWGERDNNGRIIPLHCLLGHQGSLFSVNFCPVQNIITTTSDDRSLRVWNVVHIKQCSRKHFKQTSYSCSEQDIQYWKESQIVEKLKCYGHSARVWRSLILPSCIISVGEDSKVCVWDQEGILITSWRAHDGASIWSIAATECADKVVTGGGDGSVKSWCLDFKTNSGALPLNNLPWICDIQALSHGEKNQDILSVKILSENPGQQVSNVLKNCENIEDNNSQLNIKNSLFKECGMKTLKINQREKSVKLDFPRCLALLGMKTFLVMMDSGNLYSWNQNSWSLSYKDERLMNYVVMEACPNQNLVALGTLSGDLIILGSETGGIEVLLDVKVCEGKVFSVLWLALDCILVCAAAGIMTVWDIHPHTGKWKKKWKYVLPPCKQQWVSAACMYPATARNATQSLICGDRAGSLHLYSKGVPKAQHTLRGIHGRSGVTSLSLHGDFIYSTGRDGGVRCLSLKDGQLQVITVSRVSSVNWVAKLVFLFGRPLAVCFHDVKLIVWSLEDDRSVVEVECGGGHRSWSLQASETEDELIFLFLRDSIPFTFHTTLKDKLLPLIKSPVNTHETMCLQILFQHGFETIFATGGEDTTLRLHSILGSENCKALSVIRSHISSIKALCLIERGERAAVVEGKDSSMWMVSAGGRAQVKVWRTVLGELEILRNFGNEVHNDSSIEKLFNKDVICQEVTSHMLRTGSHKTWKSQELTFDPETRFMDATAFWLTETKALLALASSDGLLRIFQFSTETERLEMVCSEEWDHCVLKVSRLQVPDTTILVSTTTGGTVTFFDIQTVVKQVLGSNAMHSLSPQHLRQLCSILAHQSGVNGISFSYPTNVEISRTVHTITMATGGDDNKLSIWDVLVDVSENTKIKITNKCNVCGHSAQITGLHWISRDLLMSTSIDQRLTIWKLHYKQENEYHEESSSNTEKMSQINSCRTRISDFISEAKSGSVDKFSMLASLEPMSVYFTGVPDVKGIAAVDVNESYGIRTSHAQEKAKRLKRIFVYGVGLQVYELYMDSDMVAS
nr:WD repeat-containing protein 6-like isoform X2 [Cherax quadricarinatus]